MNGDISDGRDRQDVRVGKEAVGDDQVEELNDGWDLLPRDVESHDWICDVAADAESLHAVDAEDAGSGKNTDTQFWEEWWSDDVPWDPGLCESSDEGYLPGALGERPCDMTFSSAPMNAHGVFLKQAQSMGKDPCLMPECLQGAAQDGILVRVLWKDEAARALGAPFCDFTAGPCPWPEPVPCKNHLFPPKVKVYVLDIEKKELFFVRNELPDGEFTAECPNCLSLGLPKALSEEVCEAAVVAKGLHPVAGWSNQIPYLCWNEATAQGAEASVCIMGGIAVDGSGLTYDVLTDELMTDEYMSLKCFAIVDGECIDLSLGLP